MPSAPGRTMTPARPASSETTPRKLIGAREIARELGELMGRPVSVWTIYRLSDRPAVPIRTARGMSRLVADAGELRAWWQGQGEPMNVIFNEENDDGHKRTD